MTDRSKELIEIVERFPGKRIAVVGDLILDEFIWGDVRRISPEAPVPIVEVVRESIAPGGAANVAMNLANLGAQPIPAGLIGNDFAGRQLIKVLSDADINCKNIVRDKDRNTTLKTRIIAHHQQVCRTDRESRELPSEEIQSSLREFAQMAINDSQAVILSDYAKGVFTDSMTRDLIGFSRQKGLFISVDPKKNDFSAYRGASILTPNLKEAERACNQSISDPGNLHKLGAELRHIHNLGNLLITLGEKGMVLFSEEGITDIKAAAREVYDVTGAGDTVIAVFTLSIAAGASPQDAAFLANRAAGIVVGKLGTATLSVEELIENLKGNP